MRLRVVPNARRNEVVGTHGDAIRIKVAAPALDGRANEELIEFVAETLGVPTAAVRLRHGARSRDKVIEVDDLDEATASSRLLTAG